jgi:hypothetical protein
MYRQKKTGKRLYIAYLLFNKPCILHMHLCIYAHFAQQHAPWTKHTSPVTLSPHHQQPPESGPDARGNGKYHSDWDSFLFVHVRGFWTCSRLICVDWLCATMSSEIIQRSMVGHADIHRAKWTDCSACLEPWKTRIWVKDQRQSVSTA